MICANLSSLLGISCHALADDGSVAMIETSFMFDDGDMLPIFVQSVSEQIRFFDDGGVLMHFRGRGLRLDDKRRMKFIRSATEPYGVTINDHGEVEVWSRGDDAPSTFARYLAALVSLTTWERDQDGVNSDASLFVDEVGMYLRAWKPEVEFTEGPEYTGISGQIIRLDFRFDGAGVIATGLHANAVASSIKKLLDIRSAPRNAELKLLAVIDDRAEPRGLAKDGLILQVVADVLPFSVLTKMVGNPVRRH